MTDTRLSLGAVIVDGCRLDTYYITIEGGEVILWCEGTWTASDKAIRDMAGIVLFGSDGVEVKAEPTLGLDATGKYVTAHTGDWLKLRLALKCL